MAKIDINKSNIPLPNEYRNTGSMTEEEREARYRKLASADNPVVEEAPTQTRGQSSGMNRISGKTTR